MEKKYRGVIVPMMTPFDEQYKVDVSALQRMLKHVLAGQASPFVLGTTGEAASISLEDRRKVIEETVRTVQGRSLVYAGLSGTCQADLVQEGKIYRDLGADVLVATMPSYYPVKSADIQKYFVQLADQLPCPLIIYNIPATTHLSIPLEVLEELSKHPQIVGLKDSERDADRLYRAIDLWKDRADFSYLLGWAAMSNEALQRGADGIVPSTGNMAPALYYALYKASRAGDQELGDRAQKKTNELSELYQKGRNLGESLAAFKVILSLYDLCGRTMLPPLYRLSETEEQTIQQQVKTSFNTLDELQHI